MRRRKSWVTKYAQQALVQARTSPADDKELLPTVSQPYQPASDSEGSGFASGSPEQALGLTRTSQAGKVVCKAIVRHPDDPSLILFGLRRDDQAWCNPGGHAEAGEDPVEAMLREFREECGVELGSAELAHSVHVPEKNLVVHVFEGPTAEPDFWLSLDNSDDPDSEFVCYQFINPLNTDLPLHIPTEHSAVCKYLRGARQAYANSLNDLTTENAAGGLAQGQAYTNENFHEDVDLKLGQAYDSNGTSPADELRESLGDEAIVQYAQVSTDNSKGLSVQMENEREDFAQMKDLSVRTPIA